MELITT
jgi:iron transport multicopper oxidase